MGRFTAGAAVAIGAIVLVGAACSATAVWTATRMVAGKSGVRVGNSPEDCADEQANITITTIEVRIISVFRIVYSCSIVTDQVSDQLGGPVCDCNFPLGGDAER